MQSAVTRRFFFKTVAAGMVCGGGGNLLAAMSKTSLPQVDNGFLASKLSFKSRSGWTDLNPKPWILKPARGFDTITVHHSGTDFNENAGVKAVIASIEAMCLDHKTRGYGDLGYHFVLDPAGTVWEGRSLSYEGAHVAEHNEGNIGIVLPGNFDNQEPTEKQKQVLPVLVGILRDKHRVKLHRLVGHRDLGRSICPGAKLYDFIQTIKTK